MKLSQKDLHCCLQLANLRQLCAILQVSKSSGELTSWVIGGHELIHTPLGPLLFRAPTDNDRGGSGGSSYLDRQDFALLQAIAVINRTKLKA